MTFLSVLVALLVERVLERNRPQRQHAWFDGYCRRMSSLSPGRWLMQRPWGPVIVLLPLLIVIGWLQVLFDELGSLFAFVFSSAVLIYALGPRDLGEEADAFLAARDRGDDERATALAQAFCLSEVNEVEPRRSLGVARAVVVLANRRLIGPIFWFVVFGAVGAAAYRAVQLLAERMQNEDCPPAMKRYSDEVRHIADWAPARITAVGYAIAGNFDAVTHAWRNFEYMPGDGPLTEAEHLLANTGLAALDTVPDDADELETVGDAALVPPVVEDALALVWRSLVAWVTFIAAGSLVAALA